MITTTLPTAAPLSDARAFEVRRHELPGGAASILRLPGVPDLGPAHRALFAALRIAPQRIEADEILVAGPGAVVSALWASRSGARITTWHDSIAEALSLEATFRANEQPAPEITVDWNPALLSPGTCDLALLHLPRGQELQKPTAPPGRGDAPPRWAHGLRRRP